MYVRKLFWSIHIANWRSWESSVKISIKSGGFSDLNWIEGILTYGRNIVTSDVELTVCITGQFHFDWRSWYLDD
jgi:hypothetical protein